MATYIFRPNGYYGGSPYTVTNATSNADMATKLGDNSDTTSVSHSNTVPLQSYFTTAGVTVASDEFIVRVGNSMRVSGSGIAPNTNGVAVGVQAWRTIDNPPTNITVQNLAVTSTVTYEVSQTLVQWSRADVASGARITWQDGRNAPTQVTTYTYDIWGTLYTIKQATATPSLVNSTASYVTVPVTLAATIDWESSASDASKLRRVDYEVRIESGGTGAGTGTLVSSTTGYYQFTATGSQVVNVTMPDAIANGSYKIYARAYRWRDSQTTPLADQYSAWSTAATLTQSVTLPNAPLITTSIDQPNVHATITVTPQTSTGYTSPLIDIQRSDDGGTTWTNVRNGYGIAGAFGTGYSVDDYEAARGVSVLYRARVRATNTGVQNASAWANATGLTLTDTNWNLKVPENSALNMYSVRVVNDPSETLTEDLGVYRPLDRRYPVVVAGQLGGWDGKLEIVTATSAEWAALKAILEAQKVLLLESAFGWNKYIRITGGADATMLGSATAPRRRVDLTYVQTTAP